MLSKSSHGIPHNIVIEELFLENVLLCTNMNQVKSSYSWIEVLIALAIMLIIGRFIWAQELAQLESVFFSSLDISENIKYLLTVPLFCLVIYGHYKDGTRQVQGTEKKVISRPVIVFAVGSLITVGLYLWSLGK